MPPKRRPAFERIRYTVTVTECWIPHLKPTTNGYVYTHDYAPDGSLLKHVSCHRTMYLAYRGAIPDGHDLDHLCRNRACCNPWHLEAVTRKENLSRGAGYSQVVARTNVCRNGHDLTSPGAASVNRAGKRRCRECRNAYRRQRWAEGLSR